MSPTSAKPRARQARERTQPHVNDGPAFVQPVAPGRARKHQAAAKPCTDTVRAAAPAHSLGAGARSVRYAMPDHERAVIDAALTILGGYLRQPGAFICGPGLMKEYVRLHIGGDPREVFAVLFVDSQRRLIAFESMFVGTLSQAAVHPREIAKAALVHDAAAVVLAHNHPSGSVQPSRADEALTQAIKQTLALVDVRVLDHVIVSADAALSMAEQGVL